MINIAISSLNNFKEPIYFYNSKITIVQKKIAICSKTYKISNEIGCSYFEKSRCLDIIDYTDF